ncbi:MAG: hypothetical protein ACJ74O_17520 [Frankiaceae bacterium]
MSRRTNALLVAGAALAALPLWSASASAATKPTATVTCDGGIAFTAEIVSLGTFHEAVSASNFQVKYLAFGDTVVRDVTGVTNNHDLLSCTYVGPTSGNHYVLQGFFTPAS